MTREDAVRKLMEVAKERFNAGKGIIINDVPFFNYGCMLEMKITEDANGMFHSMEILLGPTTVSYITADLIREINVDFSNILLENGSYAYGYINNEHFECE